MAALVLSSFNGVHSFHIDHVCAPRRENGLGSVIGTPIPPSDFEAERPIDLLVELASRGALECQLVEPNHSSSSASA